MRYAWGDSLSGARSGADGTPAPPDPDPEPPASGTFGSSFGFRLAPGALEGTVDNAVLAPLDLTDSRLRTVANGGLSQNAGTDIRIEVAATDAVVLYERDSYDAVAGTLTGWLRLPSGVGAAGLVMRIRIGAAAEPDQSADPALVWAGYLCSLKSSGVDRVAGNSFAPGSGVTTNGERRDGITLPGTATAATSGAGWRAGPAVCRMMLVKGTEGQVGTNKGWTDQGELGLGANRGAVARNRATGIGTTGTVNSSFYGEQFSGGFAYIQGPTGSAVGADWKHHCVNFVAGVAPSLYIEGRLAVQSAALTPSGTIQVQPGIMQLGRGPFDLENAGWEGAIAAYHERTYAYGPHEAALLCRMLQHDWSPLQLADGSGNYADLPTPPDLDAAPPPVVPEGPGMTLPTPLRTVNVANQTQLNAAYAGMQNGDRIVLADGSYTSPASSWVEGGSVSQPVQIVAQNLLGARITSLRLETGNIYFHGVDFPGTEVVVGLTSQSDNVRFWRCRWRDKAASTVMGLRTYKCADMDIAYCEWVNWGGRGIAFGADNGTRRPRVRRCLFRDTPVSYGNSREAIQAGFGYADRPVDLEAVIELCRFVNWNTDDETVSIKSSKNIMRQCTFENNHGRCGNRLGLNNTYEAIIFKGSRGIRIHDKNIRVLNCDVSQAGEGLRVATGDHDADTVLNQSSSPSHPNGVNVHIAGCTGPVRIAHAYTGDNIQAKNTRVRQHASPDSITLVPGTHTGTDNQPNVAETLYTWVGRILLANADVGPSAP